MATPRRPAAPVPKRIRMGRQQFDNLCEALQIEVDDRIHKMRQKSQLLVAALRLRLDMELNRFPAEVRAMDVSDFVSLYDGDVKKFLSSDAALPHVAMSKTPARNGASKSLHRHAITNSTRKTPRMHPYLPATPAAIAANSTVAATSNTSVRRSTRIVSTRESSVIALPVSNKNKEEILLELDPSLSPSVSGIRDLDSPAKQQVQEHLSKLQAQLQRFMDQIKK